MPPMPSVAGAGLLHNRNFVFYMVARVLSTFAIQMQSVAIGWQVYQMTGSLYDLGLIGLAQFAPFFILILLAGHAADRYNRRSIILLCMLAQLTCGVLLFGFTFSGAKVVWPVFAILVLYGSARAFMMPASQAILVNLVSPDDFKRAVAISSSSFHVAVICGPIVGGLLYIAGPVVVYAVVGALLLVSLLLMSRTTASPQVTNREPPSLRHMLEGLRFVWSRPVVLGAISLDLFAVLFGGATALLPAYAHDVLRIGPTGLGMLRTAPGVGAAITSVVLAWRPITRHVGLWMFGGVALFGAGTVVLGSSIWFPVSLASLFFMGAGDMVSVYIRHLLVQIETPDAIRGRVSAVNAVFIGASNELGEFESGVTAGWMGLVPALIFGGAAILGVTAIWMWRFPVLRTMDRLPTAPAATGSAPEKNS
ncbi:MAG: MFS transporter [Janthinobacterium lividum]